MKREPMPSRSGVSHPLGKFTAEFPKFKGPEQVREILKKRAAALGMSLAEYLRERAIVDALGVDTVKRMHADRVDVVARIGEEKG